MNNFQGRAVIYLVAVACLFIILFGIRGSAAVLNPILLAAVITITVLPIPGRLKARGMPGWLSLVLTILIVTLVLGLVVLVLFLSVTALATDLPTYLDSGTQQTSGDTASSDTVTDSQNTQTPTESGAAGTQTPTASGDTSAQTTADSGDTSAGTTPESGDTSTQTDAETDDTSDQTTSTSAQLGEVAQGIIESVVNLLVQFGWALVIFFFMLSAAISMPAPSRLGMDPNASSIGRVSKLTEDVRKYMSILTVINLMVAVGDTIFLMIIGVEYAVLWGLLAWFMGYIPSIGFMIALIPPVLMAYAQFGIDTALIVLGGYIVINGGVQNFIQPKIMGKGLRISPVVVFVGLFVWGYLLGGIGAILAVPLTMIVLIIMENVPATHNLAILMRYTGEEKKGERQEAAKNLKGTFGRMNIFSHSDKEAEDDDGNNGDVNDGEVNDVDE